MVAKENIFGFKISVSETLFVNVVKTLEQLEEIGSGDFLSESAGGGNVFE